MSLTRPSHGLLTTCALFDGKGVAVPYALRGPIERLPLKATTERTADLAVVIIDLGERPNQHDEIQVITGGANFRRRLLVEGSDDRKDWKPLLHDVFLINLELGSKPIGLAPPDGSLLA